MTAIRSPLARAALILVAVFSLGACNTVQRLSEVDSGPDMTSPTDPRQRPDYRRVSMPMPDARPQGEANLNSLWRPGARAFFKDQRASRVGDILTVRVAIEDAAALTNETNRSRSANEDTGIDSLLGYNPSRFLPKKLEDETNPFDVNSGSDYGGTGEMDRQETINLTVAAVITQILPNGNLVITGRQEVRVNRELREVTLSGVVRPEDISNRNTINSDKIAEARVSYGGRGTLSDVQRPRWGQEVFDIIFPF